MKKKIWKKTAERASEEFKINLKNKLFKFRTLCGRNRKK